MRKAYIFIFLCLVITLQACGTKELPKNYYRITSSSMEPLIYNGAIVKFEADIDESDLEIGDYVLINIIIDGLGTDDPTYVKTAMIIDSIGDDTYELANMVGYRKIVTIDEIVGLIVKIDNP